MMNLRAAIGLTALLCVQGIQPVLADVDARYEAIASKMHQGAAISQAELESIGAFAAQGASGMSYDERVDLAVDLSRYGDNASGRALTQHIHDEMAAAVNVIADERLVFNTERGDPYVEDNPDTVVDLRGLAERCASNATGYKTIDAQVVNEVRGAILEYQNPRGVTTRIEAKNALRPYGSGSATLCSGMNRERDQCSQPAAFRYDRLGFPASDKIQSSKYMHIYIRHLIPVKRMQCDTQNNCTTSYIYTAKSGERWADLQCKLSSM